MWIITCPAADCGHEAPMEEFEPSCADECTCPKCGAFFAVELSAEDEDDE